MPARVIILPRARAQIRNIQRYIATASYPGRADRYIPRLRLAIRKLGDAPFQGAKRDDIGEGFKSVGFERRIPIVFSSTHEQVLVAGVYYAGRLPNDLS